MEFYNIGISLNPRYYIGLSLKNAKFDEFDKSWTWDQKCFLLFIHIII